MNAWIIERHETESYCGIAKPWFDTEAWLDEQKATARLEELQKDNNSDHSGVYFTLEKVELID